MFFFGRIFFTFCHIYLYNFHLWLLLFSHHFRLHFQRIDVLHWLNLLGYRRWSDPISWFLFNIDQRLYPIIRNVFILFIMRFKMHLIHRRVLLLYLLWGRIDIFLDFEVFFYHLGLFLHCHFLLPKIVLLESIFWLGASQLYLIKIFWFIQRLFLETLSHNVNSFKNDGSCCLACIFFIDWLNLFLSHLLHLYHLSNLVSDLLCGLVSSINLNFRSLSVIVFKV